MQKRESVVGEDENGQVWVKEFNGHNLPLKVGNGGTECLFKFGSYLTWCI